MALAEKRDARRQARASRAAFLSGLASPVRYALQRSVAQNLTANLPVGPVLLASYVAIGDEIDPAPAHAAVTGATILFPRVAARNAALTFHPAPAAAWKAGPSGIPQPPDDAPQATPRALLVPLLAVDRVGNRLGQGGGYYDRTLAHLRAHGPVLAIGIAWDIQRVEHLPAKPWDQPLDALVTPSAFLWFGQNAMPDAWN